MSIGKRIKEILEIRGMSQADLGRKIGMRDSDLSEIINDKRAPTAKTMDRLARGLGVSVKELYPEEGEAKVCRLLLREIGEAALWEFLELIRKIKRGH